MCVVSCEQAWAILEAERGDIDHARSLLRTASEKDPCDLYIWQVCAWGPCCAHVPACDTIWPVLQTRGTGVQRASTCAISCRAACRVCEIIIQETLCRTCTVLRSVGSPRRLAWLSG